MSGRWAGSDRRSRLPSNWSKIRLERFELDDWRCVDCGHYDPSGATLECDHIGDRNDHRLEVLRTRCGRRSPNNCHGKKSSREGNAQPKRSKRLRAPEQHPGLRRS